MADFIAKCEAVSKVQPGFDECLRRIADIPASWLQLMKKARSEKAAKAAEIRPRAPKPPTEVGGRGAPAERADIAAARAGDFKAFDSAMRAKYRASR